MPGTYTTPDCICLCIDSKLPIAAETKRPSDIIFLPILLDMSFHDSGACSKREDKKRKQVHQPEEHLDLKMQAQINKIEIEEAKREIKVLRRALGAKGVELEQNTMTIQRWIQTNEKLFTDLRRAETNIKTIKENSDKLNEECNEKISKQAEEIDECKQELITHTEHIKRLTTENTTLRNEVQTYKPENNECIICMENTQDTVFVRCGHRPVCFGCAEAMPRDWLDRVKCPICRQNAHRGHSEQTPNYVRIIT